MATGNGASARPPAEPPKSGQLRLRILSALVLGPLVLLAIYLGSPFGDFLFVGASGVLAWEWARLCNSGRFGKAAWLLTAGVLSTVLAYDLGLVWVASAALALSWAGLAVFPKGPRGDQWRAWYLGGLIYLSVAGISLIWLRATPGEGLHLLLWLLAVVWATDIGAYAAGKAIGGPKIAPSISPNKTWAGLLGGIAAATLAAWGVERLYGDANLLAVVLGGVTAIVAQAGDFLESWIKRRHGAKDSSQLIPGHGGLFDRVDGLIAGAIFLAGLTALGLGPV